MVGPALLVCVRRVDTSRGAVVSTVGRVLTALILALRDSIGRVVRRPVLVHAGTVPSVLWESTSWVVVRSALGLVCVVPRPVPLDSTERVAVAALGTALSVRPRVQRGSITQGVEGLALGRAFLSPLQRQRG